MPALYDLTDQYKAVLDEIEANGGELSEELLARFQAIEGDWDHKIAACAAMSDHLRLMGSAFREIADRKRRLAVAYAGSAASLKTYIAMNMQAMGNSKVEDKEIGVRVRLCNSPASAEALDESATPTTFLIPQPPTVDKKGILAALKQDQDVAGWQLVTGRKHVRID